MPTCLGLLAVTAVALTLIAACAPSLPVSPPASATSPSAERAPPAVVGQALREDPPLPGEATDRWEGLDHAP